MSFVVPAIILLPIIYALFKGVDVYDAFVEGARGALPVLVRLLPNLAAMLAAIALLRASGCIEIIGRLAAPLLEAIGIPSELATLIILRPFSGSASLALLSDTLNSYGADSFVGLAASVGVGSTETILYTITMYCGSVGIKNSRYAIPAALLSGIVGIVTAVSLVRIFCQ